MDLAIPVRGSKGCSTIVSLDAKSCSQSKSDGGKVHSCVSPMSTTETTQGEGDELMERLLERVFNLGQFR